LNRFFSLELIQLTTFCDTAVMTEWSQIDVLINAAGVLFSGTILETDEATWEQVLDINLKGTYLVSRAVLAIDAGTAIGGDRSRSGKMSYLLAHAEYATGSCLVIDGGNTAGGAL
jgi:hypothetical protein